MTAGIFELFTALIVLIGEVLLGNCGIPLPLSMLVVLYFSATLSYRHGLFLAIFCGMILDSVYARELPFATGYLLLTAAASRPAQPERLQGEALLSVVISGAVSGGLFFIYALAVKIAVPGLTMSFWDIVGFLPLAVFGGALLCPIFFWFMDCIAKRIDVPIFYAAPAVTAVERPRPRRLPRRKASWGAVK